MNLSIDMNDPADLPEPYPHGTVVSGARRLVFVSGQPPWTVRCRTSSMPKCRLAWHTVFGAHRPAITIIIAGIYSEEWPLEIEGIAAE